jgi:hypothetical protein
MMRKLPVLLFLVPMLVGSINGRLCAPFPIAAGIEK